MKFTTFYEKHKFDNLFRQSFGTVFLKIFRHETQYDLWNENKHFVS